MAKDRTHTGPALLAHDMGGQKIQSLGRSTEADGAARIDDIDHLVKARNADETIVGGLMEKTADSSTVARGVTVIGGVERVQHRMIPTTQLPLPGIAGGRVGVGPLLAFDDHQHPLESPAVTSSYLFPVQIVTRAPSTSAQLPVVSAVDDVVVDVTYEDLSSHSYQIGEVVATLPNDPDVYLKKVTCEVTEAFAGPGLESFKFHLDASRNYYGPSGGIETGYGQDLIPEPSARAVSFADGFEAFGVPVGTKWETNPELELQCMASGAAVDPTVSIGGVSSLILDALTAGAFEITLEFERRTPSNSHCIEVDHILDADGENTGASKTLALWCPITPNSGLRLNGLRIGVQSPLNTYPEGLEGDIKIGLRTADGTVVVSPFDIRQKTYDTYWELLGIDIPFASQLLLTVSRGAGTIADIGTGLLQFDYTFTQTTGGEVTTIDYRALTAAQATETDKEPFEFNCQIQASSGETLLGQVFATLAGTPGVSAIPAEEHLFQVRSKIDYLGNINFATVNQLRATVSILRFGEATPDAPYLVADGKAMFNTEYSVYEFAGTPASPPSITSLDTLVIAFYAMTDSTDMVGFYLAQDEQLSTWVRFPFSLGGAFGTLNHFQLTPESRMFTAEQAGIVNAYAHPWSSLYPDRPRVLDRTIATVAGVLTVPTDCGVIFRVSGTEALATIATDGWDLLSRITLVFTQGRDVQHGTGNIDTMMPTYADPVITVVAKDTMTLYLDEIASTKTWIRSTAR